MKLTKEPKKEYSALISNIGSLLEQGRKQAYHTVNQILVKTHWEIGKQIVEYEQKGKKKAEYGSSLLDNLLKDLKLRYGKGFSKSNVYLMRMFYLKYQKFQTLSGKLSWSHYVELLSISQKMMAKLFDVTIPTINEHLKNIYQHNELEENSTIRNFRIVQKEGAGLT